MKMESKEKAILAGLFFSKFNKDGLDILGFNSFSEAINVIGLALNIKPASIKNYRDEFDPMLPNDRKGWHKRDFRINCKKIYDEFKDLNLDNFANLIRKVVYSNLDMLNENTEKQQDENTSFAKRLITGQAAENYFRDNYSKIDSFKNYELEDTTQLGCGFDFKLHTNNDYLGIEVKGLNGANGNILLTDKEHYVAKLLSNRYFLFVVKNFKEKPFHNYYQNPLKSELSFSKVERKITQTSWRSSAL